MRPALPTLLAAWAVAGIGCTQLYADRVVLVSPQTYLRAKSVDAQGVAILTSNLQADELHAKAVQYQTVKHYRSGE